MDPDSGPSVSSKEDWRSESEEEVMLRKKTSLLESPSEDFPVMGGADKSSDSELSRLAEATFLVEPQSSTVLLRKISLPFTISEVFPVGPESQTLTLGGCTINLETETVSKQGELKVSLDYDDTKWIEGYTGIFPVITVETGHLELLRPLKFKVVTWFEPEDTKECSLFYKASDECNWSMLDPPTWIGREIFFESKHNSKYWLSYQHLVGWLRHSRLWIANSIYYNNARNFTTAFCLDDDGLIKVQEQLFKTDIKLFPGPKVASYEIKEGISYSCKLTLEEPEKGYLMSPHNGYTLNFDSTFWQKYRTFILRGTSQTQTSLCLYYTITQNNNESIIVEDRQAIDWPIIPSCTEADVPIVIKHLTPAEYDALMVRDDVYKILPSKAKGKALVINNRFANTDSERKGSERDYWHMCKLWSKNVIGCDVKKYKDLSRDKLLKKVQKFAANVGDVSMCVVFIGSHGGQQSGEDAILCEDGNYVTVHDVLEPFNSDGLSDIPKLFLLQCCRGEREETVQNDRVPAQMHNYLIGYPTIRGFISHRNVYEGSWFIQAVTEVFVQNCRDTDVLTMMRIVKDRVGRMRTEGGQKQTCEIESKLKKKLYLCPGQP